MSGKSNRGAVWGRRAAAAVLAGPPPERKRRERISEGSTTPVVGLKAVRHRINFDLPPGETVLPPADPIALRRQAAEDLARLKQTGAFAEISHDGLEVIARRVDVAARLFERGLISQTEMAAIRAYEDDLARSDYTRAVRDWAGVPEVTDEMIEAGERARHQRRAVPWHYRRLLDALLEPWRPGLRAEAFAPIAVRIARTLLVTREAVEQRQAA